MAGVCKHSTYEEQARKIPVYGSYDTVVVGGGFAGVAAAIAAARGGNKVLLCERLFMLGGLGTAGLVTIYLPICDGNGHQVCYGITEELLKLSIRDGWEKSYPKAWLEGGTEEEKVGHRYMVQFNASSCAILMEQLLQKEGVEILYGTTVCDAPVSDGRITHLIVENKSGRSAIEVGNVLDCSGDADVCKYAGEETAEFEFGNTLAAWYYEYINGEFRLDLLGYGDILPEHRTTGVKVTPPEGRRYRGLEADDVSQMMLDSHAFTYRHFLEKGKISTNHMLANIATTPQLRMTRRIVGCQTVHVEQDKQYFADSVGVYPSWRARGPVYELPFSALHGKSVRNLAVAGRIISASDTLWELTRVIPVCAVSGEAVGTAAALCRNFDEVDLETLQNKLRQNGVKLHVNEVF